MSLPIRHKWIFQSRWIALLWAGGIIWSAVEFAGTQPGATPDNNAATADGAADPAAGAAPGDQTISANDFADTQAAVAKLSELNK